MTNAEQFALLISNAVLALAIWLVYFWLFKWYLVDRIRQQLFEIRDRLFDLPADGRINFSDPAYGILRIRINGLIRYAHRLTIPAISMIAIKLRNEQVTSSQDPWLEAMTRLQGQDPETARALVVIHNRTMATVGRHVLLTSPFFVLAALPLIVVIVAIAMVRQRWAGRVTAAVIARVDTVAEAMGEEVAFA